MKKAFFTSIICAGCLAAGVFFTAPAWAVIIEPPAVSVTGGMSTDAEVGGNGANPEVSESWKGISISIPVQLNPQMGMDVELAFIDTSYDWSDVYNSRYSGRQEPWSDLYSLGMAARLMYDVNDTWSGLFAFDLGAGYEDDMSDAFSIGLMAGGMYRFSPGMGVLFGGNIVKRPEDTLFIPILQVSWFQSGSMRDSRGLSVRLGSPQTEVRYMFSRNFSTYWNLNMELPVFRLADDNPISPSGVVEMEGYRTGLFADFRPIEQLVITGGIFYRFNREWEYQDQDGYRLSTVDVEDAPGTEIRISWSF